MKNARPGLPPLILAARETLHRKSRRIWFGLGTGIATAALVLLTAKWLPVILPAVFVAPLLTGSMTATWGERAGDVADAQALERAWTEQRDRWATDVVAASVENAEADVKAWSQATHRFRSMHSERNEPL